MDAGVPLRPRTVEQRSTPIVIAHRGASGYRPEHTLAAYALAIDLGADYVEPDLVPTRDGVLVARHEGDISGTTDVAQRRAYASRRTTRTVDGVETTGWFVEDFTLAELRGLRCIERLPALRPGNTRYDGWFTVPTFDEILDLVEQRSRLRGEVVGVYPELKHPTYFAARGLDTEEMLIRTLRDRHLDRPNARVFVQCFETATLRRLRRRVRTPLVQLVEAGGAPYDHAAAGSSTTFDDLVSTAGLAAVASYADGIGVHKRRLLGDDGPRVVREAHAAGLRVHVFTLRDENAFVDATFRRGDVAADLGDAEGEHRALLDLGVDGIFTDYTDTGLGARARWKGDRARPSHRRVGRRAEVTVGATRS